MENLRSFQGLDFRFPDDAISPINMLNLAYGPRKCPNFDPYASDSSESPSSLIRYLRCTDTTAIAKSKQMFFTPPLKVEEDVIVMDGIPVHKSNKGGGEVRTRLPLTSSSVVGNVSGGRSSSSQLLSGPRNGSVYGKQYKNKLCRYWVTGSPCQFGSECQFAHGKEELRPSHSSCKIQVEISKPDNFSEELSLSLHDTMSPGINLHKTKRDSLPPLASKGVATTTPVKVEAVPNTNPPISDWSPTDDGIEPGDGKKLSKEQVDDAVMNQVLYGTNLRKRLSVFKEICPE